MATGKERFLIILGGRTYNMTLNEITAYANGKYVPAALPAPTSTVRGGVLQGVNITNQGSVTISGADVATLGTSATNQVNILVTKINQLRAAMVSSGLIVGP